ncbi:MAG: 8-amino-7-oxononanoate synthase [Deltaproteobacteria bacterium]|nr:8-amino-7-oxononanoate synthase [Deltaproteobacteria bacterium]
MEWVAKALQEIEKKGLKRSLREIEGVQDRVVMLKGVPALVFCSNNYLGLANHPKLIEAGKKALEKYGVGSGASRLISGNMKLHEELESSIAQFKRTEAALLFNSGYHANIGLLTTLTGPSDQIFSDELNHASLIDGCRLSRAQVSVYKHQDVDHLKNLLQKNDSTGRKFIVTDGVFSMDGDVAPLPELVELGRRYEATVVVDDAHGTGVMGETGRGTVEHFGIDPGEVIQMATLGKALGVFGAFIACTKSLRELLMNTARSFIFTTSLPPVVCAMAMEAIKILSEESQPLQNLRQNIKKFSEGLSRLGWVTQNRAPIFPLLIGDPNPTMALCETLLTQGIYAQGIRPPTVPEGTSRLRFTLMATHTEEDLDAALNALASTLSWQQHRP